MSSSSSNVSASLPLPRVLGGIPRLDVTLTDDFKARIEMTTDARFAGSWIAGNLVMR